MYLQHLAELQCTRNRVYICCSLPVLSRTSRCERVTPAGTPARGGEGRSCSVTPHCSAGTCTTVYQVPGTCTKVYLVSCTRYLHNRYRVCTCTSMYQYYSIPVTGYLHHSEPVPPLPIRSFPAPVFSHPPIWNSAPGDVRAAIGRPAVLYCAATVEQYALCTLHSTHYIVHTT